MKLRLLNLKLLKNQNNKRKSLKRRNNNLKRRKLLKKSQKSSNKKMKPLKLKRTHWTYYPNPHSIHKLSKEKFAILKTNWLSLKTFGLLSIMKDGHFGEFTTSNTKVKELLDI